MNKGFMKIGIILGAGILFLTLLLGVSQIFAKVAPFSIVSITANCNGTGQVFYTGTIPQGGFTLELKDKASNNAGAFISTVPPTIITITSGASPVSYVMPLTHWSPPHYRIDSNHNTKSESLNCQGVTPTPTPTVHHYACVRNSCQLVAGTGDNSCNPKWINDCQEVNPSPTPTPHHFTCIENECVQVAGAGDSTCETDQNCQVTPSPTPTPPQEVTPTPSTTNVSDIHTDTTEPPTCTDGNTLQLPANPFVVRNGSEATVNFFITQGDSANIFVRVSGTSWDQAVTSAPDVKPNSDKFVSYTFHDLNPKTDYDFGIEQKFGCGGGQLVIANIHDAAAQGKVFRFTSWSWAE